MKFEIPKANHLGIASRETSYKANDVKPQRETNEHAGERRQQGFIDRIRDDSHLPYRFRIDHTPAGTHSSFENGYRGESKATPNTDTDLGKRAAIELEKRGLDGIDYRDGFADFSKAADATVKIDHMSDRRLGSGGNFDQAREKLAEQWNKTGKDGKSDWTKDDVRQWCRDNRITIHEREDGKTCDFVSRDIHDAFPHCGGVSECKARGTETSASISKGAGFLAIFDN